MGRRKPLGGADFAKTIAKVRACDPLSVVLAEAAEDTSADQRLHEWLKKLLAPSTRDADGAKREKRKRPRK